MASIWTKEIYLWGRKPSWPKSPNHLLSRWGAPVPRFVWHSVWPYRAAIWLCYGGFGVLFGTLFLGYAGWPLAALVNRVPDFALYSTVYVLIVGTWFVTSGARRHVGRIAQRARSFEYAMCFECGYALIGLGEEFKCPECGTAWSLTDLHQRWQEFRGDAHT